MVEKLRWMGLFWDTAGIRKGRFRDRRSSGRGGECGSELCKVESGRLC